MKLHVTGTVLLVASVEAFTSAPLLRRSPFVASRCMAEPAFFMSETIPETIPETDAGSFSSAYDRFGAPREKIALGIDINEVLQWLGTKEDITAKIMKDNSGFSRERAETEVEKFLMDAEMITAYLQFEKGKESRDLQAEADGSFSDPKILGTYAAWIVGGASFGYIRKTFIEPKFESGEWQEFHFSLPGMSSGSEEASSTVVDSVAEATSNVESSAVLDSVVDTASNVDSSAVVDSVVDAASNVAISGVVDSVVDAASNAVDLASTVVDAASNVL